MSESIGELALTSILGLGSDRFHHPLLSSNQLLTIGVSMDCLGTIITGFGLLYQKRAHMQATSKTEPTVYYKDWSWVCALGLYVGGQFVVWCAMALCEQTLVACLNCLTMAVGVLGAGPILGEKVSRSNFAGVGVLVLTLMWVVRASAKTETHMTAADVVASALSTDFLILSPCLLLPATVALVCDRWMASRRSWQRVDLHWLTCLLISATLAWFSTVMAKALAGLVFTTIFYGEGQLLNPVALLIFFPTVALMVGNIHFMNLGMMRGVARVVIPTYEALTVTGQVALGSAYYGEFPHDPSEKLWFLVRVAMVVLGTVALVQTEPDEGDQQKVPESGAGETSPILGNRP